MEPFESMLRWRNIGFEADLDRRGQRPWGGRRDAGATVELELQHYTVDTKLGF